MNFKRMMSAVLAVSMMSTAAFAKYNDSNEVKPSELVQLIAAKTATLSTLSNEISELRQQIAEKRNSINAGKTTRNVGLVVAGAGVLAVALGIKLNEGGRANAVSSLVSSFGGIIATFAGSTVAAGGQIYVWVKSSNLEELDQALAAKQIEIEGAQTDLNEILATLVD